MLLKDRKRCINLAGADGSGKTTQAGILLNFLHSHGIRARRVWLRFPRLFCVPFLVYARVMGFSYREKVNGHEHGYWEFYRSWIMGKVFPWALLLDTALYSLVMVSIPLWLGQVIICDRFVLDIMADLMVGLDDHNFDKRLPGRLFLALLPRDTQVVIFDLQSELAKQRSVELLGDRTHINRRQEYLLLAQRHHFPVISTAGSIEQISNHLRGLLGLESPVTTVDGHPSVNAANVKG